MNHFVRYPPAPIEPVHRPIMLQGWKDLTYLHWSYDPDAVQQRLPAGLEVDTFADKAWVGLVAFRMERIRLPGTPGVPYFGTFPETNVRTYVVDRDGRPDYITGRSGSEILWYHMESPDRWVRHRLGEHSPSEVGGAVLTAIFGFWMLGSYAWSAYSDSGWLTVKLVLVALLVAYHLACLRIMRAFREKANRHGHVYYRWFNEVPALLLIAIILLAVVKPF